METKEPTKPNGTLTFDGVPPAGCWSERDVYWDLVDGSVWVFDFFPFPYKSINKLDWWVSKGYKFKPLPSEAVKEVKPQFNKPFKWPDYWSYAVDVETEPKETERVFKVGDTVRVLRQDGKISTFFQSITELGKVVKINTFEYPDFPNSEKVEVQIGDESQICHIDDLEKVKDKQQTAEPFKWPSFWHLPFPDDDGVELATTFGDVAADVKAIFDEVDPVNNPQHYGQGSIECIDYIKDFLTREEYIGYLRGNIAKYLHRYRYKGKALEDLKKAAQYLKWLIETEGEIE